MRDEEGNKTTYDHTQWVNIADIGRLRYYFHTYSNKDWKYVDVMNALKNAKTIQKVIIEVPPSYEDVTNQAK